MKDYLFPLLIFTMLGIITFRLESIENRLNDMDSAIIGSSEAVITEFYRYKGD